MFKVDQHGLKDHLNKLLKEHTQKSNHEKKTSGIDVDENEKNLSLNEVTEMKKNKRLVLKSEKCVSKHSH